MKKAIRSLKILVCLLSLPLINGCMTAIEVTGSVPEFKLDRLGYIIGACLTESFREQVYEESPKSGVRWKVDFSNQNDQMTRALLEHLFEQVIYVDEPGKLPGDGEQAVDGYLEPRVASYEFLVPQLTGQSAYSASIHYELYLYNKRGDLISVWKTVGFGKSELSSYTPGQALALATLNAIRDGTGRMGIELTRSASQQNKPVLDWLKSMGDNR